jgi:hypothetical protein
MMGCSSCVNTSWLWQTGEWLVEKAHADSKCCRCSQQGHDITLCVTLSLLPHVSKTHPLPHTSCDWLMQKKIDLWFSCRKRDGKQRKSMTKNVSIFLPIILFCAFRWVGCWICSLTRLPKLIWLFCLFVQRRIAKMVFRNGDYTF